MSKYYCLMAGLPDIALDDSKPAISVEKIRQEAEGLLTRSDKQLFDLFFLKYDNRNLINRLRRPESEPDVRGCIAPAEMDAFYIAVKEDERRPGNGRIPSYFETFLRIWIERESREEEVGIAWEDRLSALYYAYAMKCRNRFVADWFELNLNITNVLTAVTCRKHGLDKAAYIVGDNEVANAIVTSGARDFGLADAVDYMPDLLRIVEETDLMAREKKVDLLKWNWLEEHTFFKPFDIENLFAYLVKTEMIERWVTLDRAAGEQTFRQIVGQMKKGSEKALFEFKRNNER